MSEHWLLTLCVSFQGPSMALAALEEGLPPDPESKVSRKSAAMPNCWKVSWPPREGPRALQCGAAGREGAPYLSAHTRAVCEMWDRGHRACGARMSARCPVGSSCLLCWFWEPWISTWDSHFQEDSLCPSHKLDLNKYPGCIFWHGLC